MLLLESYRKQVSILYLRYVFSSSINAELLASVVHFMEVAPHFGEHLFRKMSITFSYVIYYQFFLHTKAINTIYTQKLNSPSM